MSMLMQPAPLANVAPPAADPRALETAWAQRLRRGDPAALVELAAAHGPRLSRLAFRLMGWRGDPEDVVQDVLVKAMEQARRFDGKASVSTWITAIALNHCRSLRRRWLAAARAMARWPLGRAQQQSAPAADEEAEHVRCAMRKLRPADREAIVLHYYEEMDLESIAALLGLSRNAVEVRLHRARKRLGQLLEEP